MISQKILGSLFMKLMLTSIMHVVVRMVQISEVLDLDTNSIRDCNQKKFDQHKNRFSGKNV